MRWKYDETNRIGDHICYISDLTKLKSHYPKWRLTHSLDQIVDEILDAKLAADATIDR
jgi:CDP-paratose 2-epimerase